MLGAGEIAPVERWFAATQIPQECVFTVARLCFNPDVNDEPVQLPIDGVLDLHTFKPREIKDLVPDYLAACRERGILQLRIIHGKGIGNLRRTVHEILSKHPGVVSFSLDYPQFGGWGATIVRLKPSDKPKG